MTVEYALSRTEVMKGYFYSLKYAASFRWRLILVALGFGPLVLGERRLGSDGLRASDARMSLLWSIGLLVLMPLWLALRLKRHTRRLELTSEGVVLVVGNQTKRLSWSVLLEVADSRRCCRHAMSGAYRSAWVRWSMRDSAGSGSTPARLMPSSKRCARSSSVQPSSAR